MCESVNIKVRVIQFQTVQETTRLPATFLFPEFNGIEMHAEENFLIQMPFH